MGVLNSGESLPPAGLVDSSRDVPHNAEVVFAVEERGALWLSGRSSYPAAAGAARSTAACWTT